MSWLLDWAWSQVSWWWLLIAAIIAIGFAWQWIAPLWLILPRWIKIAIAGAIAIIVAVQYGRNRGAAAERDRRTALNKRAVQTRDKIDEQVKAMPPNAVTRALERGGWLRDD